MPQIETRKPFRVLGAPTVGKLPIPLLSALTLLAGIASIGLSQPPPIQGQVANPHADPQSQDGGQPTRGGYERSIGGVAAPLDAAAIAKVGAAGDMIGFSHSDASGTQTITIVHTGKSWMAVYHIDRSGTIRLVSSRPIDADFSLQLNATSPLPDEIRQIGRR